MFLLLIIGVIIFFVVRGIKKNKEQLAGEQGSALIQSLPGKVPGTMVAQTAGTTGYVQPVSATGVAGVQMSKKACKQTCKGICGKKPLIAIGKKAKAKKAAWEVCDGECQTDVCGW